MIPVVENFITHQGEGPNTGRLSRFIRFMGCPVGCSWCDTPYTWKPELTRNEPVDRWSREELEHVMALGGINHVVLTGGEPLIHAKAIRRPVLDALRENKALTVEFETAGYHDPIFRHDRIGWRVSPKLSSANHRMQKSVAEVMRSWLGGYGDEDMIFKVVVASDEDMTELLDATREAKVPHDRVWLMPEGTTGDGADLARGRAVQNWAITYGMHFSFRTHVALHGGAKRLV